MENIKWESKFNYRAKENHSIILLRELNILKQAFAEISSQIQIQNPKINGQKKEDMKGKFTELRK